MTSARKPAGAPEGWDEQNPAGAPHDEAAPGNERLTDEAAVPRPSGDDSEQRQVEKDLDELLADVTRERDEYLELARRAKADFENYRKRAAREAEEAERRGKAGLARDLIPVVDNLERALRTRGVEPDADPAAPGRIRTSSDHRSPSAPSEEAAGNDSLAHGVRLVYRELRSALHRAGVESYDPAGERFDPAWHEAIATSPADGVEAGVIVETAEKGYRLDGQVLRAARVIVSE